MNFFPMNKGGGSGYNTLLIDNNGSVYTSEYEHTIDISQYLPNDYHNLTIDNFYLVDVSAGWRYGMSGNYSYDPVLRSYDASTGMLYLGISASYDRSIYYQWYVNYKIQVIY